MREITEYAYAKLNLSLDVLAKRPDGYHNMRMIMQTVSLCDDVRICLTDSHEISISTNLRYLPCDQRNIAYKAAKAFFSAIGRENSGVSISIFKRVPVCAGMGGGSSDGGAVLRGLNELFGKPLSLLELQELGATLGSDIPFCVKGGTVLAEGRGEILRDLAPLPPCYIVICKPQFSISTPELFGKLAAGDLRLHPDTKGLRGAIEQGDLRSICQRLYNVFEDTLPTKSDDVFLIKSKLLDSGALGAVMTGTGSGVFGVFDNFQKACEAKKVLSSLYRDVFMANPIKALKI